MNSTPFCAGCAECIPEYCPAKLFGGRVAISHLSSTEMSPNRVFGYNPEAADDEDWERAEEKADEEPEWNPIALLEIAERILDLEEGEEFIFALYDDGDEVYGAKFIEMFDSTFAAVCYYGGGDPMMVHLDHAPTPDALAAQLTEYLAPDNGVVYTPLAE